MISVKIKKDNTLITEIIVKGHANFADYGSDIVCAATSSIIITTVNALLRIDEKSIMYEEKEGFLHLKILKTDEVTQALITNMIELLKELEKKYPKNIKLL
jgi:uncharacterized protein YsxB (DUF464 family)